MSGRGYARYYSFTRRENAEVTIDLTSSVDTYLYLRSGSDTSGTAQHSNDDIESGNTDSQIVETLSAGTKRHRHAVAATPLGLTATASGANSIVLSWTPLAGASHFGVYRCLPSGSGLPAFYEEVSENVPGATYTTPGSPAAPTITK